MQLSRFHQIRGPGLWSECDEFQEVSHFAGARHVDRGGAVGGATQNQKGLSSFVAPREVLLSDLQIVFRQNTPGLA